MKWRVTVVVFGSAVRSVFLVIISPLPPSFKARIEAALVGMGQSRHWLLPLGADWCAGEQRQGGAAPDGRSSPGHGALGWRWWVGIHVDAWSKWMSRYD